jgi:hypothetical protein
MLLVRLTAEAALAPLQHGTVVPVFIHDRTNYVAAKVDRWTALEPEGGAAAEVTHFRSSSSANRGTDGKAGDYSRHNTDQRPLSAGPAADGAADISEEDYRGHRIKTPRHQSFVVS